MSSEKKIRFGIIGAGHIGKRHAEMIRRNPEVELVAMCDIKPMETLGLIDLDVPFSILLMQCWIQELTSM